MSIQNKYKILLIGTYFGSWPKWLPAFLLSCKHNCDVDWLFITDCESPTTSFSNIKFVSMNLPALNLLASHKLGFDIRKKVYAQVDLQPAYGVIFQDYIEGYDFWGHCDFDVIWGRISNFVTHDILESFQIISSRKQCTAGHFTLYKNNARINRLFSEIPNYEQYFKNEEHTNFDEKIMSHHLRKLLRANAFHLKVYWPRKIVVGWPELGVKPNGWYWRDGKVFDRNGVEHFYLHFMKWKSTIKYIDFSTKNEIDHFYVTRYGIWHQRIPISKYLLAMMLAMMQTKLTTFCLWILHAIRKIIPNCQSPRHR